MGGWLTWLPEGGLGGTADLKRRLRKPLAKMDVSRSIVPKDSTLRPHDSCRAASSTRALRKELILWQRAVGEMDA